MVLLLKRCIGAAGWQLGRPSWPVWCTGVAGVSRHTGCVERGVDIIHGACARTGEYGVNVAGRGRR